MSEAKKARPYVAIRMERDTLMRLKILAARRGVTMQRMFHKVVDEILAAGEKPIEAVPTLEAPPEAP